MRIRKDSNTYHNLMSAYAAESQVTNKYHYYYEKAKKENNRYICIGIHSNCSPASAKVIFVYMFLMISRKVTFVTQKFANPNKSNTFHNYLLTSIISQLPP